MMHKKDMIFLSILIACSESVVLFYFCSAKSPRSFLCMMISYAILLIFPLNIFLASLREHRTGTSLSTLETTEESSKQQREIEQFTHKQLKLHKNNFTQKLKELYILLEQNDLTTAQKILGEQIPLKDTDIICCTNSIVDGILQSKKSECIQHNISFEYTILFPEKNDFSFSVLISLFSNLLDNALESCKQYREHHPQNDSLFIHLSTDYKTKMFMIQMKNSKDPDIPFTRQSTKDDSTLHGHGLSIIESIAKDYGGTCQWSVEDDSFLSLIMLKHT